VILFFCLLLVRLYAQCCGLSGAPLCEQEVDALTQAQCRASKTVRGLFTVYDDCGRKKIRMFLYVPLQTIEINLLF